MWRKLNRNGLFGPRKTMVVPFNGNANTDNLAGGVQARKTGFLKNWFQKNKVEQILVRPMGENLYESDDDGDEEEKTCCSTCLPFNVLFRMGIRAKVAPLIEQIEKSSIQTKPRRIINGFVNDSWVCKELTMEGSISATAGSSRDSLASTEIGSMCSTTDLGVGTMMADRPPLPPIGPRPKSVAFEVPIERVNSPDGYLKPLPLPRKFEHLLEHPRGVLDPSGRCATPITFSPCPSFPYQEYIKEIEEDKVAELKEKLEKKMISAERKREAMKKEALERLNREKKHFDEVLSRAKQRGNAKPDLKKKIQGMQQKAESKRMEITADKQKKLKKHNKKPAEIKKKKETEEFEKQCNNIEFLDNQIALIEANKKLLVEKRRKMLLEKKRRRKQVEEARKEKGEKKSSQAKEKSEQRHEKYSQRQRALKYKKEEKALDTKKRREENKVRKQEIEDEFEEELPYKIEGYSDPVDSDYSWGDLTTNKPSKPIESRREEPENESEDGLVFRDDDGFFD